MVLKFWNIQSMVLMSISGPLYELEKQRILLPVCETKVQKTTKFTYVSIVYHKKTILVAA